MSLSNTKPKPKLDLLGTLTLMNFLQPASSKLVPMELGRVILPFSMGDNVQDVAKTQADIIVNELAPKVSR